MRLTFATAAIALLASSGSAFAADCTKGLLWPYVRNPGDCLTDTEIQAGKTGVYSGPVTGQVDVSTIKPPPQAKAGAASAVQCSHSWYWPFGGGDCQPAPSAAGTSAVTAASPAANPSTAEPAAQPAAPALPAVKPQAAAAPAAPTAQAVSASPASVKAEAAVAPAPALPVRLTQANAAECHKGVLWPFIRDAGDCPTGSERATGKTTAIPPTASAPAAAPVVQTSASPVVADHNPPVAKAPSETLPMQAIAAATPMTAPECTRGAFWPFVRGAGDCPTAAERSNGKTTAVPVAAITSPTMPAVQSSVPAAEPAKVAAAPSTAAACSKGVLWPFIRNAGDCQTTADKGSGNTTAVPVEDAPSPTPAAVTNAPAPPPAKTDAALVAPASATCTKSVLWPFIRESGDCATTADKGSGKTAAVPVSASPPPATPIAQIAPAAASPAANIPGASCTRSWLWPFVREAGDCATTTERGNGATSAVPIRAGASVETPALVPTAATMPQPPVPQDNSAPAANQPAACHKGLFWPFVREAGDCPTDADKAPQRNPS